MKLTLFLMVLLSGWALAQEENHEVQKQFPRIWLETEFVPVNFTWQDLELTKEGSFTIPISKAWKKWLNENLATTVGDVEICDGDCLAFLQEWQFRPQKDVLNQPSPQYTGDILLKISINLWRPRVNPQGQIFHWEGRIAWIDINTKRVTGIYPLGPYERLFEDFSTDKLNSALGNQIYRSTLALLKGHMKQLEKRSMPNRATEIKVKGQKTVLDLLDLMKLIQTRGSHLALEGALTWFSKDEASLLFFYQGEEKSFTDVLSRLNELKSSHSYKLVPGMAEGSTVIQMVTK